MFEIFRRRKAKQNDDFRITDIYIPACHYIDGLSSRGYPFVKASASSRSDDPLEEYINDGWTYSYDQYQCEFHYFKEVDIHTLISKMQIRFIKRTDARDSRTFGFPEGESIKGAYLYDIPDKLMKDIARYKYGNYRSVYHPQYKPMNDKILINRIIKRCAANIIDDEYNALVKYDETMRTKGISDCDNPAYLNSLRSRCYRIDMNYRETSRQLYEQYCKK